MSNFLSITWTHLFAVMPLAPMYPRHHPSMQTMRPVDDSHFSPPQESSSSYLNRAYEINERSGGIQLHPWTSSGRPSTPRQNVPSKEQPNGAAPLPELLQRVVHSPRLLRSIPLNLILMLSKLTFMHSKSQRWQLF